MIFIETKICNKCGKEFPKTTEFFYRRKCSKDGFMGNCKICESNRKKQYFQANKDDFVKYHKQYVKNNKTKICNGCKRELPMTSEYFRMRSDARSGFRNYCKQCESCIQKKRRENNKEIINEKRKQHYKNNKEIYSERRKQWYVKNKDSIKEKVKEYYQNNKEAIKKRNKLWVKKNMKKILVRYQKRRTKKLQLPHTLTVGQWDKIKAHFNNKCAYCGKEKPLAQEHFIPLSKGGEYTINNIIPVCKSCNSSKCDKSFFEWYPKYRYYSKKREKAILEFLGYKGDKQQLTLIV